MPISWKYVNMKVLEMSRNKKVPIKKGPPGIVVQSEAVAMERLLLREALF